MAITAVGQSQNFSYTGGVQTFTVPFSGIYKLEVWGCIGGGDGGWGTTAGSGYGGYSVRHVELTKGQILYVVCGGQTYNGGGSGGPVSNDKRFSCNGGGATHIATATGVLSSLSNNKNAVLVVAGGGGGNGGVTAGGGGCGSGGGLSGGGRGSGYAFGQGATGGWNAGGGGGGWYGGYAHGGWPGKWDGGGGGGSGWIGAEVASQTVTLGGKTYTDSTSNGKHSGNGKATITYLAQSKLFKYNTTDITSLTYNGTNITTLTVDGVKIY